MKMVNYKNVDNIKIYKYFNKGITLVALVITIIVLLILAGISIQALTGKNGLLKKTKYAEVKTILSTAKEETQIAINSLVIDKYMNKTDITPKMLSDEINKTNNRETYTENETTFPTYIIYNEKDTRIGEKIKVKVGENLEILEVKTESGITENNNPDTGNTGENIDIGNVNIKITDIKSIGFTINVQAENANNIALYQYYVNGNLVHEGTEKQYRVRGLNMNTDYEVEVKAIPRTTISLGKTNTKTLEAPIVEFANKFDKYIYIDASNGNDTTGDGTKEKPYATLDKIADSGIIENGYSYGIVLRDGKYNLTTKVFTLTCNQSINIIGNREKTILSVKGIFTNSGGGNNKYSLNFYRLIWDGNNYYNDNIIYIKNNMNLYSVVFENISSSPTSYFLPNSVTFTFNNCTKTQLSNAMLRTTHGTIKLTNCYGGFTSGYGTSDKSWDYQTNRILNTYTLGNNYTITEEEKLWKDVGTGNDLDESKADLGVYGGEYSWEYESDIF